MPPAAVRWLTTGAEDGGRYSEVVPTTAESLEEIRDAIAQLRAAATHDDDASRGEVANRLRRQFDGIDNPIELRTAVANALHLYRGGMGSCQDTGTAVMDAAVTRLRHALGQAI